MLSPTIQHHRLAIILSFSVSRLHLTPQPPISTGAHVEDLSSAARENPESGGHHGDAGARR